MANVDRRVVEMRFDNKDFQKNVGQTLVSLETLQKALQLQGGEQGTDKVKKGLFGLGKAAQQVDLSAIGQGVDDAGHRFSKLEVIGYTVLANLTNTAVNTGKRLAAALINPITEGGKKRALNMEQAMFMFAGLGYAEEKIGAVGKSGTIMDNIYKGVEGTFYSLDRASLIATQLMSANIDGTSQELTKHLKSIAGISSMFGADYERVGQIFAKIAASGKAMGGDLTDLSLYGVPAAQKIADYLNKVGETSEYTQEKIQDMASKGEIDFKTFSAAFEDYGDQAAKSKQLTTGAFEDMIAALSRLGEALYKPINLFKRDLFNAMVPVIDNLKGALTPALEKFGQVITSISNKVLPMIDIVGALFDYKNTLSELTRLSDPDLKIVDPSRVEKLKKAFSGGWLEDLRNGIIGAKAALKTGNFDGFFDKLATAVYTIVTTFDKVDPNKQKWVFNLKNTIEGLGAALSLLKKGITTVAQGLKPLLNIIPIIGKAFLAITGTIGRFLIDLDRGEISLKGLKELLLNASEGVATFAGKLRELTAGKVFVVLQKIGQALGYVGQTFGKMIASLDFSKLPEALAGGGIFAVGIKLAQFIGFIKEQIENLGNEDGIVDNIKGVFQTLGDTIEEFQKKLQVEQLKLIAIALGILAAACWVLSAIPPLDLAKAVAAIGFMAGELVLAAKYFEGGKVKGIIQMAAAIFILAEAVKVLSNIENIGQGLGALTAIFIEIGLFFLAFDRAKIKPKNVNKTAFSMILFAAAIRMLIKPVKELGAIDSTALEQGLTAIAAIMAGFTAFALVMSQFKPEGMVKAGASMILIALGIKILAKPLALMGQMNPEQMSQGLKALCIALVELGTFAGVMGMLAKSGASIMAAGAALVLMALGVTIMSGALETLSNIKNVGQGLTVMFGSLLILALAMAAMQKCVAGAAAMIIVAAALAIMAPPIALLSSLNLAGVGIGLLALAGTLAVFAGAALLLTPVIPLMALLGAAMAGLGLGVLALATGMAMLAAIFTVGITPFIQGLETLTASLATVATNIAAAIGTFAGALVSQFPIFATVLLQFIEMILTVLSQAVPRIVEVGMQLILAILTGIRDNIEQITVLAIQIVTNFVNGIASQLGTVIDAGVNLIISYINGMADAIATNGPILIDSMRNLILSVLEVIAGEIPIFGDYAKKAIANYRKGLDKGGDGAKKSAKKTSEGVEKNLKLSKNFDKDTKKAFDSIGKAVETSGKDSSKKAKKTADDTSKNLKIKDQSSNGSNAVKGIVSGMNSQIPALQAKSNQIAKIVDETMRKKNQIHSPSRLLAKTGKYLMQGLIQGIDNLTPEYMAKANNIATTLIDSTNGAVSAINSLNSPSMNLSSAISQSSDVNLRMNDIRRENEALSAGITQLTKTLDGMTESMNSRALNNYITVDGSGDPEAFADGLIRSFRLNARTV